jgi:hypothetical protein
MMKALGSLVSGADHDDAVTGEIVHIDGGQIAGH